MLQKGIITLLLSISIGLGVQAQKESITMDDLYTKYTFNPERVWGLRSMNDGVHYTTVKYGKGSQAIIKYAFATGDSIAEIYSSDQKTFEEYLFSKDESKIMFTRDVESIYRHSTKENVSVINTDGTSMVDISKNGKVSYATFSPDGKKVAFVRSNNLFIIDLATSKEIQITNDGEFNKIINGSTDWVYEEEFGFDQAFTWSPDNSKIAYYKFDESKVKEFNMIMYQNKLYPSDYKYKYPKAGEDNSKVSLFTYTLSSKETVKANIPETEYIPRIKWANSIELGVQTLNRLQNDLNIYLLNTQTNQAKVVYHETSKTYVEVVERWYFLEKNIMLIKSEKDGFKHIYSINTKSGKEKQITKGNWDVMKFYGVSNNVLYYQAAKVSATDREVYKQSIKSSKATKLSAKKGWNKAGFTKSFKYYINTYSDANTPYEITVHNNKGELVNTLVTNEKLKKTLTQFDISKKEFLTIPSVNGIELNAWMIKPANFDENKQYPVLLTIYGGPGVQTVNNSWDYNMMWHHMLAQKGYIVVSVDNRGTGARGADFKKSTYQQLGKLELEDYIETAKYLGNQNFIDSARIGIWGWSYGGYMSTLAISKGADYFKTAIAVAPVTNWRYYDNIYTERYMRTPQENASGYDDNSPINFVEKIKGNYLLVHGTADDNVHFQNTAELVDALVKADIQYDFYMYTDKNHGIYGGNTRKHLFTKFTNFILDKL